MNIVILGPFGYGSLADEAVLAGLLKRLLTTDRGEASESDQPSKHNITVLSFDPEKTKTIHDTHAVQLANPGSIMNTPAAWEALTQAHLFIVAGGGVLSDQGKTPARVWLGAVEHARRIGVKTAVIGVGALEIADPRERIRLQRLLHNFTDSSSTRDAESKRILIGYGLNPNRVSYNGDPALALTNDSITYTPRDRRVGLVISEAVPSRATFGLEHQKVSTKLLQSGRTLIKNLDCEVVIFHDDTAAAQEHVASLRDGLPLDRILTRAVDCPLPLIQTEMAACQAVFSYTLHGLMLAAGGSVPVVGLSVERGVTPLLTFLGFPNCALPPQEDGFDATLALVRLREMIAKAPEISRTVGLRMAMLARKEAQNARMLEFLVPKRDRYAPRSPKPKRW
ncbi:MAG: polysaccharide pyruvyl transferase family protein [Planctomycetota bacterium]